MKTFWDKCFIILICFILISAQVWLELKMPDYMSEITRLVQTEGSSFEEIIHNGISFVFFDYTTKENKRQQKKRKYLTKI